jgi:tRNA modification GTPase
MLDDNTIVAIATPPGEGALAIVRLSGPEACAIAGQCFRRGRRILTATGMTVAVSAILAKDSSVIDQVVAIVYRSPNSFTGEDMVEVVCHGGHTVPRQIFARLLEAGARAAEPGEFTRRAYLNGKMDLSQAEAVAEVIRAGTEKAGRAAAQRLEGGVRKAVDRIRGQVIGLLSDIEARLDFVEEEIDPLPMGELERRLAGLQEEIARYMATYSQGKILQHGAQVVIAGAPNAGKSTLFNALVQRDRVLVSPVPGTTRDAVEEWISLNGVPVRLVDTAGIRTGGGKIEQEGIRRTVQRIREADLVLLLIDRSRPRVPHQEVMRAVQKAPYVSVWTKSDLPKRGTLPEVLSAKPEVSISAVAGSGLSDIKGLILKNIWSNDATESADVIIAEERQYHALRDAQEALSRVMGAEQKKAGLEIVAFELRQAAEALGRITGVEIGDDVLDQIFSKFCIGK